MTQIVAEPADEGHEPDPAYAEERRLLARIERITDDADLVPFRQTLQRWVRRAAMNPTFADKLGTTSDYLGHLFRAACKATASALLARVNACYDAQRPAVEADLWLLRQCAVDASPGTSLEVAFRNVGMGTKRFEELGDLQRFFGIFYSYRMLMGEAPVKTSLSLSTYWHFSELLGSIKNESLLKNAKTYLHAITCLIVARVVAHCRDLLKRAVESPSAASFCVRELQQQRLCLVLERTLTNPEITLTEIGTTEEELFALVHPDRVRDAA